MIVTTNSALATAIDALAAAMANDLDGYRGTEREAMEDYNRFADTARIMFWALSRRHDNANGGGSIVAHFTDDKSEVRVRMPRDMVVFNSDGYGVELWLPRLVGRDERRGGFRWSVEGSTRLKMFEPGYLD